MNAPAPVPVPTLTNPPQRLHHYAFVIKDGEANRRFFEDIIGMPLVATWCERSAYPLLERKREVDYCHTFYAMGDGGTLAFFQFADEEAYEELRVRRPGVGQHIAMKADEAAYAEIVGRLAAAGLDYRETDHGYCHSVYVTSPDGLLVEFTVDPPNVAEIDARQRANCHDDLARWLDGHREPNNNERAAARAEA